MFFYTNVFSRGDKIYLRGYKDGRRVSDVINYKPYMFVPSDGKTNTNKHKQKNKHKKKKKKKKNK